MTARARLASDPGLTQIGVPDASLLALARGEPRDRDQVAPARVAKGRGVLWFAAGLVVGAVAVWSVTSDVAEDVYRARMWTARTLRLVGGHADVAKPAAGLPAMAAPPAPVIPTVDVTELPHAKEERAQGASGANGTPTATATPAPPSPGAPALENAPGPK